MPEEEIFGLEVLDHGCTLVINAQTPMAYPAAKAFCGIWLSGSRGEEGSWLEGPNDSANNSSLSYSNLGNRSDWISNVEPIQDLYSFSLINATFFVSI